MVDLPNTIVGLPNTMVDLPNTIVDLLKSVFKIIGKSHYQGQKRTQRLRCAIL